MKCDHCPCRSDRPCIFENNKAACEQAKNSSAHLALAEKECKEGGAVVYLEPSLMQRAINLKDAVIKHVLTGMQTVSPEVQAERIKTCEACIECFDAEKRSCRHPECGCYIDIKTKWKSESCPLSKWSSVKSDSISSGCGCGAA